MAVAVFFEPLLRKDLFFEQHQPRDLDGGLVHDYLLGHGRLAPDVREQPFAGFPYKFAQPRRNERADG